MRNLKDEILYILATESFCYFITVCACMFIATVLQQSKDGFLNCFVANLFLINVGILIRNLISSEN